MKIVQGKNKRKNLEQWLSLLLSAIMCLRFIHAYMNMKKSMKMNVKKIFGTNYELIKFKIVHPIDWMMNHIEPILHKIKMRIKLIG